MKTLTLLGILALLAGLAMVPVAAEAGVATSGAVLLDPFDPVPEIQFRHYGGYGCVYECGGGYDRCGEDCGNGDRRCHDGCYHRTRCDEDCDGRRHDRDGRHDDRDSRHDDHDTPPCTQADCADVEHYERQWHDGDRAGRDWYERGHEETVHPGGDHHDGDHDHDHDHDHHDPL